MPVPANTFGYYNARGVREDLSDLIARVEFEKTPFQATIGRTTAKQRIHEWQTQALASPSAANAQLEGDDANIDTVTATVRLNNRTQISTKAAIVTGSVEVFDKAGRDSEMAYQVILKGLELKRDVEAALLANQATVAGSSGAAPRAAGFAAWLTSNVSRGTSGSGLGFQSSTGLVSARVDGDLRQFQESHIQDVMELAATNGATPNVLMMSPALKSRFSRFTGIADLRREVGSQQATIIGGADAYISDFGTLTVVPSIYTRSRDAFIYDPSMVKLAVARPIQADDLAKTGDSRKRFMLTEYTLEVCNERAHALITDVQKAST